MRGLVIENGAVLTCDGEDRYLAPGRIVVRGGRIAQVLDGADDRLGARGIVSPPGEDEECDRVDAGGCTVIPGLVNCHTHLWLSLFRGELDDLTLFPWLRRLGPLSGELNDAAILRATYFGMAESLLSGTTCLCECCRYAPDLSAHVAAAIGCRLVVGGMPPSELFGIPLPHDYGRLVARTHRAAGTHDGSRNLVSVWAGAHSVYNCSADFLREAKRTATAHGYDFYIHLAECRDEVDAIRGRHGRTPVRYAADLGLLDPRTVAVHCVWLSDDDIRLFRQTGARMAHCPVSNAKLGSGVAPVTKYRAAGITVGLGTDSMVSNNTLSLFQEMRFSVLIQRAVLLDAAALTAADALRLATIEAARTLGLEREIGSIEHGKWADLVLVRSSRPGPITKETALSDVVYSAQRDEIEAVYVGGERVVSRGRLTRIDEASLKERIRGARPRE